MCDIPEILTRILENLRVQHHAVGIGAPLTRDDLATDKERRTTLYRASLASKGMARCAIPILWSSISGLMPLLRTIPSFHLHSDGGSVWHLSKPLKEEDLAAFDTYAKYVKYADITRETGARADSSVLLQVGALRGRSSICPNLQTLIAGTHCDSAFYFLAPTLKKIRIGNSRRSSTFPSYPTPAAWNLIDLLPERTPLLEELEIGPGIEPGRSAITSILELKNLDRVSFSSMDRAKVGKDLLQRLQSLPRLVSLDLGLFAHFQYGEGFFEAERQPIMFPALSELSMTCFELYACETLKSMPKDTIQILKLHANDALPIDTDHEESSKTYMFEDNDEEDSVDLVPLLVERQSMSLTKLQITNWRKVKAEHLAPLLQIGTMQHFDLEYARCSSLTDDLIEQICASWSKLAVFRLYSDTDAPVQLSLSALNSFARHCPDLHQLAIDLNPSLSPFGGTGSRKLLRLQRVTVFSVSNWSKVKNETSALIAEHLKMVFPSLIYAYVERRSGSFSGRPKEYRHSYKEDWKTVVTVLNKGMNYNATSNLKSIFHPTLLW